MAGSFAGTIPSNVSTDVNALFASLLEFSWKGIGFPTTTFTLDLRQDLAIHKFVDRDGAHVEGTGRAPLQVTARIPFYNGLSAGTNETWGKAGPLYPTQWRKFLQACADKSTGTLVHPELGPLTCKVENARTVWDANRRGGVEVDCVWIETDDRDQTSLTEALSTASPVSAMAAAASDLDGQVAQIPNSVIDAQLKNVNPTLDNILNGNSTDSLFGSFTSLVNSVKSVSDQSTLLQKSFAGRMDNLVNECNKLQDAVTQAPQSALLWPMLQSITRTKSAVNDAKQQILTKGRPIAFATTQKDATLAQLASTYGANVLDAITLNSGFVALPVIPAGSSFRYYATAV